MWQNVQIKSLKSQNEVARWTDSGPWVTPAFAKEHVLICRIIIAEASIFMLDQRLNPMICSKKTPKSRLVNLVKPKIFNNFAPVTPNMITICLRDFRKSLEMTNTIGKSSQVRIFKELGLG